MTRSIIVPPRAPGYRPRDVKDFAVVVAVLVVGVVGVMLEVVLGNTAITGLGKLV